MPYEVQTIFITTLDSPYSEGATEIRALNMGEIEVTRTISYPHEPVVPSQLLSTVKVKRPDGTWAPILQVTGVHMRLPDGTWQIFT